jgi:Domain of unknown function (DUF3560)
MTTLRVTHTAAEGTLVSGDPRPHHGILKNAGFRWSRNVGWYIQGSRDRAPRTATIERVADELRAVGFDVEVEIDTTSRTTAEREADREERLLARQDALDSKADRLAAASTALHSRADEMLSVIPFGQPILVGHHSERRDRNYRDRIWNTMGRAVETGHDADEAQRRADASRANLRRHESMGTTLRRIERLEADLRKAERRLAGNPCMVSGKAFKAEADVTPGETKTCVLCSREYQVTPERTVGVHYMHPSFDAPPTGAELDRVLAWQSSLTDEIAYWKAHVAEIEAAGGKVWGPDDFVKGDIVVTRGDRKYEVLRVNKKSVTIPAVITRPGPDGVSRPGSLSWTDTLPYNEVTGKENG